MTMINEALPEKGVIKNEIELSDKNDDGTYTITVRETKRNRKPKEIKLRFTQNGMNAILGMWIFKTGNGKMIKEDDK